MFMGCTWGTHNFVYATVSTFTSTSTASVPAHMAPHDATVKFGPSQSPNFMGIDGGQGNHENPTGL